MAGWKQLQKQYDEECDQFQADLDASVVDIDPVRFGPNTWTWDIGMSDAEYDRRQQQLDELAAALERAKNG